MKDLKIEFYEGRLVELRVDGVLINDATAIHFSQVVGAAPQLTLTRVLTGTGTKPLGIDEDPAPTIRYIIK
ncbi:serine acetyltransferase [Serratia marcescens]|uniref:serine acetyltransferase n=1 Tax=Serratia marcescens TaxID=615 RepID=UPI001875B1A6|nr:serine acetyltransferase [Serratia marcescens]